MANRPHLARPGAVLLAAMLAVALAAGASISPARAASSAHSPSSAPPSSARAASASLAVDPQYVYAQLFTMATQYLHREAGFDTNLPATVNGHDEFAAYWTQEILRDLAGFGAVARRDPFATIGWQGRPPVVPAFNVEVTVPGETQSDQIVVIGCHYDGEADSTQSAFDDASGCAIELGLARALAGFWRAQHVYPARTLRFLLFDAEEQGLDGSFHYVNSTIDGELGSVVAMFDEEQNGIGYPLRFLGRVNNPQLPLYAYMTPLAPNDWYPMVTTFSAQQRQSIQQFRQLVTPAVAQAFAALRAAGFTTLTYTDSAGRAVTQPIFTPDQLQNVLVRDDDLGSSDQVAFAWAGIPCLTLLGNYSYYPTFGGANPPPWSYPFDQPQDAIQLMNVYASGGTQQAAALTLALALPATITAQMLLQPQLVGQAQGDDAPIAAIGDIGPVLAGKPIAFDASASFEPAAQGALAYAWSFGDGGTASGVIARHTYQTLGTYLLTLTVRSASGQRRIIQPIQVVTQPITYEYDHPTWKPEDGMPAANPAVTLPSALVAPASTQPGSSGGLPLGLVVVLAAFVVLLGGGGTLLAIRRARAQQVLGDAPIDEARARRLQTLHDLAERNRHSG